VRDVAIVSFAQLPAVRRDTEREEVELVQPVVTAALKQAGLDRREVGFTISGSCDYLLGRPFSFVAALDGVAPWPPISESHVEMDGAWALYEAWVRLQCGDVDTALVYAYGKSSLGDLPDVMVQQLDPYTLAPLWPDSVSLAAMQAQSLLDAGAISERGLAEIAARSRRSASENPFSQRRAVRSADELMKDPYIVEPLRKHACPPISDGACAVVLAAGDTAKRLAKHPAWIRGLDHRIEPHQLGSRDLTTSTSTRIAAEHIGATGRFDVAELHAPFAHQEVVLREALKLDAKDVNPSGGALCANPMMVAGLTRLGEAAARIHDGRARRVLAHATSGPCLQQNLLCVMEAS
jgi:acetyl-CoA acetyltransferase